MSRGFARWWFCIALGVSLALTAINANLSVHWLDRTTAESNAAFGTPPEVGRRRLLPPGGADGLIWISQAQRIAAGEGWRIRHNPTDNAPHGREVHWSSGFAWWLVFLGHLRQTGTDEPLSQAIEYAAGWANPLLFLGGLAALGWMTARRYGPLAGGGLVLAAAGSPLLLGTFAANEVDHHGLANACALGTVLFLLMGGLGRERPDGDSNPTGLAPRPGTARAYFIASAICGGAGLWVSAATQILVLAGIALGVAVVACRLRRTSTGPDTPGDPGLWRTWGRWGGATALGFYLLEYFPRHLGLRLEVNHPLYALAWWGAGEWLAALATWGGRTGPWWPAGRREHGIRIAATVALLSPAAALAIGGSAWFIPLDPALSVLPHFVTEGRSLLLTLREVDPGDSIRQLGPTFLCLAFAVSALMARHLTAHERALTQWSLVVLGPVAVVALLQARWLPALAAVALPAGVLAAGVWRSRWQPAIGGAALTGFATAMLWHPVSETARLRAEQAVDRIAIAPPIAFSIAQRQIVVELRRALGPAADPVVLAGPSESVFLAHYGRFRVVGTLYWENLAGLKVAASIFGATDPAVARRLIEENGITHLLTYPPTHFFAGFNAIAQRTAAPANVQRSFAAAVFARHEPPDWLRPVPLPLPPELMGGGGVTLYEVVPRRPAGRPPEPDLLRSGAPQPR